MVKKVSILGTSFILKVTTGSPALHSWRWLDPSVGQVSAPCCGAAWHWAPTGWAQTSTWQCWRVPPSPSDTWQLPGTLFPAAAEPACAAHTRGCRCSERPPRRGAQRSRVESVRFIFRVELFRGPPVGNLQTSSVGVNFFGFEERHGALQLRRR